MKGSELEEARLGFIQYLRRKHFSPQFISQHGDDLFATASLEYSRKLAEGVEVENPAGFLITCAWQRTKSLLEAQGRTPRLVSTERAGVLVDEADGSPEDRVLEEDRFRKVQEAVDQLSEPERRLLELAYFEGLAVREAARHLHWHPSKAQRCHEAARRRLHELLGVESLDELELDIGLAAFLSLIGGGSRVHWPAGLEGAVDAIGRAGSYAWARAGDLARRLPFGGGAEPSTAALGSTAGRAAGVCASAALACLASGVVGPGVGGVDLLGGHGHHETAKPRHEITARHTPAVRPKPRPLPPSPSNEPEASRPASSSKPQRSSGSGSASASTQRKREATRAVASQTIESAAGSEEEVASAPIESAPVESSAPATSSSATPTQVANEQFGP
ncbi:MAG: RNA polymerase sigma factor [Solirubrobacterales bacterium]